jgi:predicted nuclease with TOPRIM domain
MNVLARLNEKIQELKTQYEALQKENSELKSQLAGVESVQNEQQNIIDHLRVEAQRAQTLESAVEKLKEELSQRDEEIEKVITQVEELLRSE